MPFGSSAENKRLERTEFRQLISLLAVGTSVLLKALQKLLCTAVDTERWPVQPFSTNFRLPITEALTQSCRSRGDPLTYIEIYAVKRSKFMRVPVLYRKSCSILYCQETKEVSNSDKGKSRSCSGYIGKASGSHFQVLVLNYLSLFAGML